MIDPEFSFEGFDAASWQRLVALFRRRPTGALGDALAGDRHPERSLLVIVTDAQGTPALALATGRGAVRIEGLGALDDLAGVAARHGVGRVLVCSHGALETLTARIGDRIPHDADYLAQWLALLGVVREAEREGALRFWPTPTRAPLPTPGVVQRTVDLVLPAGRTLLAVAWEGDAVSTAIAVRRGARLIDRVVGPESVLEWAGPLGGDLARDHRTIERAVSEALAPVYLGIFAQAAVLARLLGNPEPGAWAQAVTSRDVIVRPAPIYVHAGVLADAARAAARWTGKRLKALDLGRFAEPLTRTGSARARSNGADPLSALLSLLRRPPPDR